MHRTSRILALTTLLLPQAPPCSSPRRRLFRTRWPIRCFCWLWRFSASGGKRCFRSGLHSSCLPWAMRRVRRDCSFRRCCFRAGPRCLYPLFPLRRGTSCPSCRMAASRGVARVALRRGRAPGLGSGRTDRRRRLRCGHRRDALQRAPVSRGVCRMVPLRGPAVRFFRRRDSLEPFHRGRSRAHLRRDGSLLPGAVPVLLLCRKIASRPPV